MKRYEMVYEGGHNGELVEADAGEWVLYSQANALLQLANEKNRSIQRQLAAVTAERDQLKTALELADALRNHEKGIAK